MIYGNVMRNNCYPISVSSERIFQAIAIARYAKEINADAIAHGSTGAETTRFVSRYDDFSSWLQVWRSSHWHVTVRSHVKRKWTIWMHTGFFADFTKTEILSQRRYLGTSICGGEILDSTQGLPEEAYLVTCNQTGWESAEDRIWKGEIISVNGEKFDDKIKAIQKIEEIGSAYGIGRDCNVGDTIIGIKGRVGFEAAAPKLIIEAHRLFEKSTLSKWQQLERPGS